MGDKCEITRTKAELKSCGRRIESVVGDNKWETNRREVRHHADLFAFFALLCSRVLEAQVAGQQPKWSEESLCPGASSMKKVSLYQKLGSKIRVPAAIVHAFYTALSQRRKLPAACKRRQVIAARVRGASEPSQGASSASEPAPGSCRSAHQGI